MLVKINKYFRTANVWSVISIILVIKIILMVIFSMLESWGVPNVHFNAPPDELPISFGGMIILAVIIAPVIETALFQALPYLLFTKIPYIRLKPVWIVLISAVLFGLWHTYSIHYMIYTFIGGAAYMYLYIVRYKRGAYLTVVAIHSLANLFATLGDEYFPI